MREKLFELLYDADKSCNNKSCITCKHQDKKFFCKIHFFVDYLIANGVTVQQWIPVTERLPEDDEQLHFYDDGRMRCVTVLAYTEHGRTIPKNRLLVRRTGNEFLDQQATDGWKWSRGTDEVTHWMPLPQPPKEGE